MKKIKTFFVIASIICSAFLSGCSCEHEYDSGVISKEATCTDEGIKTFTCTLCGGTYDETINIVPHTFDEGTITKEPTCNEKGVKTFTCTKCKTTKEEEIPCIEHTYTDKVTLEPTFDTEGVRTFTCEVCGEKYTEEIPKIERTVIVSVTSKTSIPEDIYNGRYSNRVTFSFNLENQTDKDVKGVSGNLTINDLFGEKIIEFSCDFTGKTIPANSTVLFDGLGIDINEFIDSNVKLYNTDYSDLEFVYEVDKIVYSNPSDNISSEPNDTSVKAETEPPAVVTVTNKTNIPEDIYNGRYSPFVEFSFAVRNTTEKDIKGVQGVLTINDLFGDKIISFGCDFTGKTITAGQSVTFNNLGIDVNEFISEHVKLYNENYDDLQFNYAIESVVYTDGTVDEFD